MKKLEKIALQVKCGKLDVWRAAFEVIWIVQCNRRYFKLHAWADEDFDDFILTEFSHIVNMIESFDPQKAQFSTFFYKSLQISSACYRRKRAIAQAEEESFDCLKDLLTEEHEYRYAQNEGALCVENACADEELRQQMGRLIQEKHSILMNKRVHCFHHTCYDERMENLRRSACLVLFLKSSAVADDSSIRKTSIVTGISEDKLFSMKEELRDKIYKKIVRRQNVGKARDEAFFLHRKYRAQFEKLDQEGRLYQEVCRCYQVQRRRWEKNNSRLEQEFNIAPSNRDIGELLNMSERRVSYILKMARRQFDKIRFTEKNES